MAEFAEIPGQHRVPVQPIKPSQVVRKKTEIIPDGVLEAFNELIAETWDGRRSSFKLKDVRALAKKKLDGKEVKSEWLDVEPIYEKAGWRVKFDKPGWDENYDAFFEFTKKRSSSADD
jgi:hypothetical protein